jgi:hypothetical protein
MSSLLILGYGRRRHGGGQCVNVGCPPLLLPASLTNRDRIRSCACCVCVGSEFFPVVDVECLCFVSS